MQNNKLYFTDNNYVLALKSDECIPLEIKLNITKYGFEWKHIGDILYNFGNKYNNNKIYVTSTQLKYLIKLKNMTYKDVEKMVKDEIKNPE
jgi:hypothetical protein